MLVLQKSRQAQLLLIFLAVFTLLLGSNVSPGATAAEDDPLPAKVLLQNFPTVEQLPNYCGPAALSSILKFFGQDIDQNKVAASVYDQKLKATNGADLLLYARDQGLMAYSWNSSLKDLKNKLAAGAPVIVLQDISTIDRSGHFRVAIGYDDDKQLIHVMDPYEPQTRFITYSKFTRLWSRHGNWGMLAVPKAKDRFKKELDETNPVVHIDLAYVYYRKGRLNDAAEEGGKALALEPKNRDVLSLLSKVKRDIDYAAGAKSESQTKPANEAQPQNQQ